MSPQMSASECVLERFPRVSGDEPPADTVNAASALFSPRERG